MQYELLVRDEKLYETASQNTGLSGPFLEFTLEIEFGNSLANAARRWAGNLLNPPNDTHIFQNQVIYPCSSKNK
jgi:hypothetical protein